MTSLIKDVDVGPQILLNSFVSEKYGNDLDGFLDDVIRDFRVFLCYLWAHLGLPRPTKRQLEIAKFLQRKESLRKILMAFRGIGKSWITVAFCAWRLLINSEERVLLVSCAGDKAQENAKFLQTLIYSCPLLYHLRPGPNQREAVTTFDVGPSSPSQSPSIKSVGITGRMVGSRSTLILADDVESPNNSQTETKREAIIHAINEFGSILVPESTQGIDPTIIYLGTPQTEETIYANLVDREGYSVYLIPARYPEKIDSYTSKGGKPMLAQSLLDELRETPDLRGKPTDPERFNHEELSSKEGDMTPKDFLLQFMLDTTIADAELYPLKLRDLLVVEGVQEKAPREVFYGGPSIESLPNPGFKGDRFRRAQEVSNDWDHYSHITMAIDPSGRGKDETAYSVGGELHGKVFVLEQGGFKDGYSEETLEALCYTAKRNKVNSILIEANFGDGMFVSLLKPYLRKIFPSCGIEEVKHNTQKEARIIDTLGPVMRAHRLVFDFSVITSDLQGIFVKDMKRSLFYQLTHITYERGCLAHDDRLDVLAILVNFYTSHVSKDSEVEAERITQNLLEKKVRQWAKKCPREYAALMANGFDALSKRNIQRTSKALTRATGRRRR